MYGQEKLSRYCEIFSVMQLTDHNCCTPQSLPSLQDDFLELAPAPFKFNDHQLQFQTGTIGMKVTAIRISQGSLGPGFFSLIDTRQITYTQQRAATFTAHSGLLNIFMRPVLAAYHWNYCWSFIQNCTHTAPQHLPGTLKGILRKQGVSR